MERRPLAAAAVVAGGLLAVLLGPGLVTLLRDRLHYQCASDSPDPERAGWMCVDGIGYLAAGFPPLVVAALVVLAGLLLVLAARVRIQIQIPLAVLALLSVGVGLAGSWHAVATEQRPVPVGVVRTDFWIEAVLPSAIVAVSALVLMVVGLVVRGRAGVILTSAAAGGILLATVLQPGLALSTMPALGLVVASAVSAPQEE